jgi:DNA polymerase-3 subunit epsilon
MLQAIYFDTETTGLYPDSERIIEIAAYNAMTNQSFVRLINPGRPIPPEASQVHRITDDMVQSAPDFKTVGQEFLDFCSGDVALIAHNNLAFDLPFLKAELTRSGLVFPKNWIFLDTLHWARYYRPDLPKHALQYLRQIYAIAPNQAHRALDDVLVLKQVFELMMGDLPFPWVVEKLLEIQTLLAKKSR